MLYKEVEKVFLSGLLVRILGFLLCGLGSIPGWGTEISQAAWHGQNKKKKKVFRKYFLLGEPSSEFTYIFVSQSKPTTPTHRFVKNEIEDTKPLA